VTGEKSRPSAKLVYARHGRYTHKLGTAVTMATATGASDPAPTSIYAPVWNAASPPVVIKTPPAVRPSSGGVLLSCSWDNSAGASVVYYQGDPLAGERCAGIVSYYPARPVHHCIHSVDGGGAIICCPGEPGCPQG
jgi:hypothetical protein